jgi:hypothetical protein
MDNYIEAKEISLDDFLNMGNVKDRKKEIYIKRINKKIVISAIGEEEFDMYRKQATNFDKKNGSMSLDHTKHRLTVLENHIVEPDFSNKKFLDNVGCTTAQEFFAKKFSPGVISEIYFEISKLSDFDKDFEELAEEAKN